MCIPPTDVWWLFSAICICMSLGFKYKICLFPYIPLITKDIHQGCGHNSLLICAFCVSCVWQECFMVSVDGGLLLEVMMCVLQKTLRFFVYKYIYIKLWVTEIVFLKTLYYSYCQVEKKDFPATCIHKILFFLLRNSILTSAIG